MFKFNTIENYRRCKNGKIVVVLDDEDRENEGSTNGSRKSNSEAINFMAKYGRG